jgi:uncharacterized protein (TIRG00374 family)
VYFLAEAPKPVSILVKRVILVSTIVGYAALILYLIFYVGLQDLFFTLGKINIGVYAFALTTVALSIIFHTLVWYKLLKLLSIKLSFRKSLIFYWVGIFVDNIIPGGWSGDLFKAYLLSREPEIDSGKAVASVVTKNMYEAIFNLGNLFLGLILLLLNYTFESTILFSIGTVMVLLTLPLAVLLIISFRPEGAKKVVAIFMRAFSRLSRNRWDLKRFEAEIDKLLDDYHAGMKTLLQKPKVMMQPLVYSFIAWALEVFTLFLVFAALGFIVMPDEVIIVRSIAGNLEAQGYAFAGYAQIVATALYTALGIQQALAASAALLGGMVVFWLKTAIAYIAFHFVVFTNYAKIVQAGNPAEKNGLEAEEGLIEDILPVELFPKEKSTDKG